MKALAAWVRTVTIGGRERPRSFLQAADQAAQAASDPPGRRGGELLEGPALEEPVFHSTSLESQEEILPWGVDGLRNRTAILGRGFYLSSKPIERTGPGVVLGRPSSRIRWSSRGTNSQETIENWGRPGLNLRADLNSRDPNSPPLALGPGEAERIPCITGKGWPSRRREQPRKRAGCLLG
jgi:hypothetical protein